MGKCRVVFCLMQGNWFTGAFGTLFAMSGSLCPQLELGLGGPFFKSSIVPLASRYSSGNHDRESARGCLLQYHL